MEFYESFSRNHNRDRGCRNDPEAFFFVSFGLRIYTQDNFFFDTSFSLIFFHKRHFRSKLITMAFFKKSTDTAVSIGRVKLRALFSQTKSTFNKHLTSRRKVVFPNRTSIRLGKRPCRFFRKFCLQILFLVKIRRQKDAQNFPSESQVVYTKCLLFPKCLERHLLQITLHAWSFPSLRYRNHVIFLVLRQYYFYACELFENKINKFFEETILSW